MNRYTRDEIIAQGLDTASCPTVTIHDMPGGIVQPNAWAIKWLQNALDMFHRKYPFASDITEVSLTARVNNEDVVLTSDNTLYYPSDFVIDVKDGITGTLNNSRYVVKRLSYLHFRQRKLSAPTQLAQRPDYYCIVNNRIKVTPKVREAIALNLEYYKLSTVLDANDTVNFPDEWSLIEFIRLRALEWTRSIEPGTAQLFLQKQLAGLRASGLLHEPEWEDGVPLETSTQQYYSRNQWMGNPHG